MEEKRDSGSYEFAPGQNPAAPPAQPGEAPAQHKPLKPLEAVPDRICPHCGFNIFGKTRGGRCPQCAAPLENTAQDLLQFSGPAWLRTMSNGLLMIAAAVAGHMLAASLRWNAPQIGAVIHVCAASVLFVGSLMATRVESAIGSKVVPGTTVARWSALAAAVVWCILLIFAPRLGHAVGGIGRWLTVVALGFDAAFTLAFGLYINALAHRLPDDSLASQSINASWFVTAVCIALMAIQALELTTPVHLIYFSFCSFPMVAGFVAILLWGIAVVVRMAIALRASAIAAEDIAIHRAQWNQKG